MGERSIPTPPSPGRGLPRLLATTVLLPLLAVAIGLWQQQRGADDAAEFDARQLSLEKTISQLEALSGTARGFDPRMQFRADGRSYGGPLALTRAREVLADVGQSATVAEWSRWLPPVVIASAGLAAALSALVLLAGAVLGWRGRASRDALVRGFSVMRRALPLVLGAQILLAGAAFTGLVGFEAAGLLHPGRLSGGDIKMLMLAGMAVLFCLFVAGSALLQLRRTMAIFTPDPLEILGRPVSREEAPGLWRLLDDLAARLGALRPDHVVVGLTEGFFVSSGPKLLQPSGVALAGRTLYLPLPYMALLREDEVATIIGHELAHFSGGDTEYSLRFVPIYAGVGRSLEAVGHAGAEAGAMGLLLRPALQLGLFVMERFHHAVRHWSRLREFAADAAGAGVTSADAAARALLRTGAVQPRIAETLARAWEAPDAASPDLVQATLRHAREQGLDDPATHLEQQQPHPTDTHPPTRQRLDALGQPLTPALLAAAAAPPADDEDTAPLAAYFAAPPGLCRAATEDLVAMSRRDVQSFHAALAEAASAVGEEERVLRENTRLPGITLTVLGGLFVVAAGALASFRLPGLGWREQYWIASLALALALFLVGRGLLFLRRGEPAFLTLRRDSLALPGLDGAIAWDDVADFDVSLGRNHASLRLLLPPGTRLPALLPGARKGQVKLDPARRIVTLAAILPRGMTLQQYADLLGRYRHAARARALLAAAAAEKTDGEPA